MSVVTNILLTCSVMEAPDTDQVPPAITAINTWLEHERYGILADLAVHAGGHKHMEACLYGGAFNGFDTLAFLRVARAQQWEEPEHVRILVQEQEENHFRVFAFDMAHDGVVTQLTD